MEEPGDKMEEIYALPPKLKYTESWLKLKEKKGVRYLLLHVTLSLSWTVY